MISPQLTTLLESENAASPATLQVDVIADLICPWCYLGKRRLDEALAAVRGPGKITWYPFQINPAMPIRANCVSLMVTVPCWPISPAPSSTAPIWVKRSHRIC